MMFVVRTDGRWQDRWMSDAGVRVAVVRRTPDIVPESAGLVDLFCIGDDHAADHLRENGWQVVLLRDGWYADDHGGGVAIWGEGLYWEIRDTPLSVSEAVGPSSGAGVPEEAGEALDVRRGIFGV